MRFQHHLREVCWMGCPQIAALAVQVDATVQHKQIKCTEPCERFAGAGADGGTLGVDHKLASKQLSPGTAVRGLCADVEEPPRHKDRGLKTIVNAHLIMCQAHADRAVLPPRLKCAPWQLGERNGHGEPLSFAVKPARRELRGTAAHSRMSSSSLLRSGGRHRGIAPGANHSCSSSCLNR